MVTINKRILDLYKHKTELLTEEDSPSSGVAPIRTFAETLKNIHEFYTSSHSGDTEYSVTVEDVELDGL